MIEKRYEDREIASLISYTPAILVILVFSVESSLQIDLVAHNCRKLLNTFVCSFKALRCRSQCRFKRVVVVLVTMNRDMGISKRSNYPSAAARNVSQSTTDRRNGSNACTFIALFFDYIYCHSSLPTPPVGQPFTRQ